MLRPWLLAGADPSKGDGVYASVDLPYRFVGRVEDCGTDSSSGRTPRECAMLVVSSIAVTTSLGSFGDIAILYGMFVC